MCAKLSIFLILIIKKRYIFAMDFVKLNKMNQIIEIFVSIWNTFFVRKCIVCGEPLSSNEKNICAECSKLYEYPEIKLNDEFFAPLRPYCSNICVLSWYSYTKKAIAGFKFREEIYEGKVLSNLLAKRLKNQSWINDIDYIVPVPLTKSSLKKRGFNQCEIIATIIGKQINKPVLLNNLVRIKDSKSQHTSGREERYQNVKDSFEVVNPFVFESKNVLLIDDVITTCSTLAACCEALKKSQDIEIFIGALASDRENI